MSTGAGTFGRDGIATKNGYNKTRLLSKTYPNSITTNYTQNANNWLTGIDTSNTISRGYSHDGVGNITAIGDEYVRGDEAATPTVGKDVAVAHSGAANAELIAGPDDRKARHRWRHDDGQ